MQAQPLHVLLVEDSAGDARLLSEQLKEVESPQLALVHVQTLREATERARLGDVDVLLLDLSLPDAQGLGTVVSARAACPRVPIVVLTGFDDETIAVAALKEGAQDYLVKGRFEPQLLLRAIRYAIERHRAEEAARRLAFEQAARAQAEAAERRSRFLAEAARVLAAPATYDQTLQAVVRVGLPMLGEAAVFDVLQPSGRLERGPVACADPSQEPLSLERLPTPAAVQARRAALATEPHPALGAPATLTVPLVSRDRMLGALTFVRAERYARADVELASELADRAAVALENAALQRAREEVLAVVSHDLRNPLSVITVASAALRRWGALPEEKRAAHVQKIERSAQRMNHLIRDLLDVARIDAGSFSVEARRVPVPGLLAEAEEALRPLAEEKGLRLLVAMEEGLVAQDVVVDRERLFQVFSNLVGNALKYTPEGGEVVLGAAGKGAEVRFFVKDSGPGIAPGHIPHLFDRFWRARQGDREGAGLGLAIAKGVVNAHGGNIWVESEPGCGAMFCFTLRAVRTPALDAGMAANDAG